MFAAHAGQLGFGSCLPEIESPLDPIEAPLKIVHADGEVGDR